MKRALSLLILIAFYGPIFVVSLPLLIVYSVIQGMSGAVMWAERVWIESRGAERKV